MTQNTPAADPTKNTDENKAAPKKSARFTQGSIWKHITIMTVTAALGLTFTFFVDFLTLFWLSKLGNTAITASVAIAGAIMFLTISFSIAFMIPAVALVSRELGRGERELARQHATASIVTAAGAMAITGLLALLFLEPLLMIVGGNESPEVLAYARTFLSYVLPSIPLFAIGMATSAILRAEGDGLASMYVTLIGGFVALVLDPILIIWLQMEVVGAGIVVVVARLSMAVVGLWYVIRKYNLLAPLAEIEWKPFAIPFFAIAIPAMLTQASTPIGNIIVTRAIAPFGEDALAGFAVNFRLMLLAFGGAFALSGAIGGIIGQNYGAGNLPRVREAYLKSIIFGAVYSLVMWVMLMILRPFVADIFTLSSDAERVTDAFVFTAWHFVFVSALFVSNAAFNNLGRPLYSTGVNWFRDVLLTFPVVLGMASLFGDVGVVYSQALVGILAGTLAAIIGWRYIGAVSRGEVQVERNRK